MEKNGSDMHILQKQGSLKNSSDRKIPKEYFYLDSQERSKQKRQVTKKAFVYLHKYFLAKDIKDYNLDAQKAQNYADSLSFSSYLPKKLGLPCQITAEYCQWFLVFFIEYNNERSQVFEAASMLYDFVLNEGIQMLKAVKGFQFYHIKIILQIVSQKLMQRNPKFFLTILKNQISSFVEQNRFYEASIQELQQLLKIQLGQRTSWTSKELKSILKKIYKAIPTNDLIPLIIGYLKKFTERKDKSLKICVQFVDQIKKSNILTEELFIKYLENIKSHSQINHNLIQFFRKNGQY